ncbi:MAG: YfhO family protein [Erysipelotrichaceae bacterium]|nr:YfhO family protein [Erysipelotrichaceae bacterium]
MTSLILLAIFAMMAPSFIQGKYFVGGGDVKTQWFPFYTLNRRTTINALRNRTLPFYSFVLFLGNNIWASKSSYGLFDIYNVITYLIDKDYFFIYNLQVATKILASGIAMYLLIKYIYQNKKTAMIAGLCYGLSSFAIYFTSQPGFLSFYSLAPFYFLGIEHYLKENRKLLFIFTVFILLITNYYFFYSCSALTPIYFIYRYLNINKKFKGLIKSALILIAYYFIGVLMSGVVVVPAFLYVLQNERVGGLNTSLTFRDLNTYFHLFISTFVPSQTYIYGNNIFDDPSHNIKEVCLFSGTVVSVLIPQFLSDKDKLFKFSTLAVYLILISIAVLPVCGSIMNGLSDPCFRWFFVFIIFNIIVTSRYLSGEELNKKTLVISLAVETVIIVLLFALGILNRQANVFDYSKQLSTFVLTIFFMIAVVISLIKGFKYFWVITFIELTLFAYMNGVKSTITAVSEEDIDAVTSVLADNDSFYNLQDYLISLEEGNENEYYRIYVPYDSLYWAFSHDLQAIYNVNGLMSYDSTYAQSFNKMKYLNYRGVVDIIDWEFNIKDVNIMNFLSTKYSITATANEIPFTDYEILDSEYRGTLVVAKNNNYRQIGSTYNKSITYYQLREEFNNDTSKLNEYLISNEHVECEGSDISSVYDISYYNNCFNGAIDVNAGSVLVIGLPYDKGWKININGEATDYFECNGGFIGLNINEGHNEINMYFMPEGFKAGALMTGVGFISYLGIIIVEIRKRKSL